MLDLLTIILQGSQTPVVERVWGGGSGPVTGNWSDPQNWSDDSVPTSTDVAKFNATSTAAITVNVDANCKKLTTESGYTGTITVDKGKTLTVANDTGLTIEANTTLVNNGTIIAGS